MSATAGLLVDERQLRH